MIANYHTHTWRCNHAKGTEEQYITAAIKAGIKLLGFSDHTPYRFAGDYYSSFRMRPEQLDGYVSTCLTLRQQYQEELQIPIGLEAEYYPMHFPELMEMLKDYPLDYLILGQHHVGNEYDAPYCGLCSEDESLLKRYVAQSCDAMQTGLFSYFAHPDLFNFQGPESTYRTHMSVICKEAKSCGIPLECNLLGLALGRNYPHPIFWELAAQEGCTVILGRDAHTPDALLDTNSVDKANVMLARLGLTPIDWLSLRSI